MASTGFETRNRTRSVRFADFELDLDTGELRKRGIKLLLREQSFKVLAALLGRPGQLITREELHHLLWGDGTFVEFENNLNSVVAHLREVLSDSADRPRFIETLPRRGYRFVAKLDEVPQPASAAIRKPRLLVLPFADLDGSVTPDYLSEAIVDDLITEIASLARDVLAVIARTTASCYKNADKSAHAIGRELDVDYIVEGSIRHAENQIVMNIQLIQTKDEAHLFAKKYELVLEKLFSSEAEVARAIVVRVLQEINSIHPVRPERSEIRLQPTSDMEAYRLYLQGRHEMYKSVQFFAKAKGYLDKAIQRDPRFALAHNCLGELYWWSGFFGLRPPKEAFTAAIWEVLRALENDNSLAESHGLLGKLRHHLDFNWGEVNRELQLALELNPSSPFVRFCHATSAFIPHGRLTESIAELDQALELDSLSVLLRSWLAISLYLSRDYDRALKEAYIVAELAPNSPVAQIGIGNILRDSGNIKEAVVCHRNALAISGGSPQILGWLGLDLAMCGEEREAREILNRLHQISMKTYVSPTSLAWVYVGLQDFEAALSWLEKAIDDRDPNINPLKTFPFLDPLRHDARLATLLKKMNLEP